MNRIVPVVLCALPPLLAACGSTEATRPGGAAGGAVTVNGAGATFPYPIYSKWFDEYHKRHPDVQINYQSIGSGGGIRQLLAGTVDFGASDSPMTDEQLAQAPTPVLHFPTVLGAVVPSYNIPELKEPLRLTPEALAGIFLGRITRWNDRVLAAANPGAPLPDADIVVVHRSDGSGTSFVWTDYLSQVSDEWRTTVGRNTSVKWPVGLGGKGNEGVAGLVSQTPNSIGYVELVYAIQARLPFALVQNAVGEFVKAEARSVTAAAAAATVPDDYRVSITNAPGPGAYPISSFTWLLVPTEFADARKGRIMKDFLVWMLEEGQAMAADLAYAPLPEALVVRERQTIERIRIAGDAP